MKWIKLWIARRRLAADVKRRKAENADFSKRRTAALSAARKLEISQWRNV